MSMHDIALIGLAVMGQNLALNMARNGFAVTVYNRTWEKTEAFMAGPAAGTSMTAARDLASCVASLKKPRRIFLMVKAGRPVDMLLDELVPLLDPGDIVMDGGNSHYPDTVRRIAALARKKISYLGVGVSGGEKGALEGPSIMPGGPEAAWKEVAPILDAIAARARDRSACTGYMGREGAGHFVKMVHNGIEYGDMQLIAEIYDLLSRGAGLPAAEIADVFDGWNAGPLKSYLVEISALVLRKQDDTATPLVDRILDVAGSKGTGKWTTQAALDLGVATPTINAAVEARLLSTLKTERLHAASILPGINPNDLSESTCPILGRALYMAKLISYAQGFAMIQAANDTWQWDMNPALIARVWRAGCIIRADFLDDLATAFTAKPNLPNLLLAHRFEDILNAGQLALRDTVALAARQGIPVPALSASLAYYDSYRSSRLPANLIQAQRDHFGAHTYQREDREGVFHSSWE